MFPYRLISCALFTFPGAHLPSLHSSLPPSLSPPGRLLHPHPPDPADGHMFHTEPVSSSVDSKHEELVALYASVARVISKGLASFEK